MLHSRVSVFLGVALTRRLMPSNGVSQFLVVASEVDSRSTPTAAYTQTEWIAFNATVDMKLGDALGVSGRSQNRLDASGSQIRNSVSTPLMQLTVHSATVATQISTTNDAGNAVGCPLAARRQHKSKPRQTFVRRQPTGRHNKAHSLETTDEHIE